MITYRVRREKGRYTDYLMDWDPLYCTVCNGAPYRAIRYTSFRNARNAALKCTMCFDKRGWEGFTFSVVEVALK